MEKEFYKMAMILKEIYFLCLQNFDKNDDITPQQLIILKLIAHKGEIQNNQICDELKISKGTASGIVKRLLEKGLVEKIPLKEDKRNHKIVFTKKGLDFCYKYKEQMDNTFKNIFKNFSEEEVYYYTKILNEILLKIKIKE